MTKEKLNLSMRYQVTNLIVSLLISMFICTLPSIAAEDPDVMKSVVNDIYDAINAHDLDKLASYYTDDLVLDIVSGNLVVNGNAEFRAFFAELFEAFPDLTFKLNRMLTSDNIAVCEFSTSGTLTKPWLGIQPTGKSVESICLDIMEFENGKIKHVTNYRDVQSMLIQLGHMPTPEMPELKPSFELPDPEPTGLSPLEAEANAESIWNTHNIQDYAKLFRSDADIMVNTIGIPMNRDAFIASQEMFFSAFPDLQLEVIRSVDMGNGWVLSEHVYKGTNTGSYLGLPPTGRPISVRSALLTRFDENGLQTNFYSYWDQLTVLAQLGILQPPKPEGYDNVFFMSLSPGLNMISLPLKPLKPYTAKSFAEEIGSTVVIRYNETKGKFEGFSLNAPGDGFPIEGGKGYIVNVPKGGTVVFTGAAWTNEPPVEAAPSAVGNDAWAVVLNGSLIDGDEMKVADGSYTVRIKNLQSNLITTETADSQNGYFSSAWADLNKKAVVKIGDKIEFTAIDSVGKVVSGPFVREITLDNIRDAVIDISMRLGDIIPDKSALLQNYPNPFNPETWIPFHLEEGGDVIIKIYSVSGELIKTLNLGYKEAGIYVSKTRSAYWDGRNETGEKVASGIYFYSIQSGEFKEIRKMVIMK